MRFAVMKSIPPLQAKMPPGYALMVVKSARIRFDERLGFFNWEWRGAARFFCSAAEDSGRNYLVSDGFSSLVKVGFQLKTE